MTACRGSVCRESAAAGDRVHAPRRETNMAGVPSLHPVWGTHGCTSTPHGSNEFGDRREASSVDHVTGGR